MPTSRSSKTTTDSRAAPTQRRFLAPIALIVVVAVLTVTVIVAPASLIVRFLPPEVHAADLSGTLWHGSAGRLDINGQDAGALEWRVHPLSLFKARLSTDVHWVKGAFVADGMINLDRKGCIARDLSGGGPMEDLRALGVPPGNRGTVSFKFRKIAAARVGDAFMPTTAIGRVSVDGLVSNAVAQDTDLGGYALTFGDGAITPDSDASASLNDTGTGPLELQAGLRFTASERSVMMSGTVKERGNLPAALAQNLRDLSQLHARDAQGRIPFDFEFRL